MPCPYISFLLEILTWFTSGQQSINMNAYLKSIIHFSLFFMKKDIKSRFAGSALGIVWLVIQPICLILIYFFVFSSVLKIRLSSDIGTNSFLVFLLIDLFPWLAFQEGCIRAATSIIDNAEAVKKIPFPLESLPIGVILSCFCIHFSAFFIFVLGYLGYDFFFQNHVLNLVGARHALLLPVYVFFQLIMTIGIGFFFAAFCTYLRDLAQVFNILFQVWFYATPIVYPLSMVPDRLKTIIQLNPLTSLIQIYRDLLLAYRLSLDIYNFIAILFPVLCFFIGSYIFIKLKKGFADVL